MNLGIFKEHYLKEFTLEKWIYFSVFLLPTYLIKINVFSIPSNIWELMVGVGFFWWLLDKRYKKNLKNIYEKYKKYVFSITLIFSGLIASTLLNENYRMGLGIIKGWFIYPMVFFFISFEMLDFTKTKKLFQFFYFSAVVVATISLIYRFFGQMTFDERLQAFFNSPNYLAMYLSPALIIGIVLLKENKKFYAILLPLILVALFCTHSFMAWVAVIISISSLLFLMKEIKRKNIIIIGSILLILFCFFVFEFKTEKMEDALSFNNRSSFSSRMMIWRTAEKLIQDNFIWGIGPGNFQNKYLEYQKFYSPYLEWAVPHPHNLILTFWLYSGILGLAGFIALVVLFFKEFFKEQKNALKFMAFGIMLYILIHGFLDTTYFKNDLAAIFWLAYLGMMKKEENL